MEEFLQPPPEETKRRWKRLEQDLASGLAGWLTVASGSKSDKGDAKSYLFLGECKYRRCYEEGQGYMMPLDLQWLEAIWRHAHRTKKVPLLALEWGDGSRALLIPEEHFLEWVHDYIPTEPQVTSKRIVQLPVLWAAERYHFFFKAMEVPERYWVMLPWEELSWLRTEELVKRKELGAEPWDRRRAFTGKSSLGGRKTFNLRPKGAWKK